MTIDNKDGAAFLAYVTDKLETRIAHISQSILEGQKDIEAVSYTHLTLPTIA